MTKKERNMVYKKMLGFYDMDGIIGVKHDGEITCYGITVVAARFGVKNITKKSLPELYQKFKNSAWFMDTEGYLLRIMALLECIKETN